jgi:hypothetical protein
MNKCFQKVPPKEPPRDIYTRLEAFVFLGFYETDLSLPIYLFRFHRFKGVIP